MEITITIKADKEDERYIIEMSAHTYKLFNQIKT